MIKLRGTLVACCALLLAACSTASESGKLPPPGSPSSSTRPTSSVTATPSPSASPSASTEAERKAAVAAAVRRYFADVNTAMATGETTAVLSDTTSECPCRAIVASIKADFAHGRDVGSIWTADPAQVHDATLREAHATVGFTSSAYTVVDSSGKLVSSFSGRRTGLALVLVLRAGRWQLDSTVTIGSEALK